MADAAIGVVTEVVLKTVVSLVAEEINLVWGMKKQLRNLAEKLKDTQALLSDAQSKQVTSQAVQCWLKKLQSFALDAQIVLDELSYDVVRQKIEGRRRRDKVNLCFSSSSNNPLFSRLKRARKIRDVLSSLEDVHRKANEIGLKPLELINSLPDFKEKENRPPPTSPYVDDSKIVGRDVDVSDVVSMLTCSDYDYERDLLVIAILGMGGQGKTTLAQLVCKSDVVESYFDKTIWVCVSDDFNVDRLLAKMMQSPTETNNYQSSATTADLVNKLKYQLSGKKYLLVLDDVWNDNGEEWERMMACLLEIGGSKGSKILATTRSDKVASVMQTSRCLELGTLSEEQSWELFEKCAFANGGATRTPQLVEIGKRICTRCGGVPLAIKMIGSSLCSKHLKESDWSVTEKSGMWSKYSGGDRVIAVIKLSYDRLPSLSVKQCFASCAIFEKDTALKKDQLIQLWMAQGLLNPPPQEKGLLMEDMGDIYFNILLRNSLIFQVVDKYSDYIIHYKMHDLVHDVSLQVSENYCFHINNDYKATSSEIKAVHISINSSERGMWKSLKGVLPSKLRTLSLKGINLSEVLFEEFQCLSVLIIDDWGALELSNSIGKMKHLRFLDISHTNIHRLPESFTKLYHLQTLRIHGLNEIPKGFENLINLRHIHVKGDYSPNLFPRFGQLRNLQTLPSLKVGKCKGCQIEESEHLENLRGTLTIFCLQTVGSYESAAKSNLSKKSNIQTLELCWENEEREENCDDSDVMEGLKPHSNSKNLTIQGYQSRKLPSWMVVENDLLILHSLVKLTLRYLDKCERLPSLGRLPFLEFLEINSLDNVKCIGKEFYGCSNIDWVTKSSGGSHGSEIILFPALRILCLQGMRSLVEWSDVIGIIPTKHLSPSVRVKVFPSLEVMDIFSLPNLSVLPNLATLQSLRELSVSDCGNLTISYGGDQNIRGLETSSKRLGMDVGGSDIQQHHFPSLHSLSICSCDKLIAPICSLIPSSTPLESLTILCNPRSWPKDLRHLSSLRRLRLGGGRVLNSELDCLPWPYPSSDSVVSLTSLALEGSNLPGVRSLPHQIQQVTTLRELSISSFDGLEGVPEWVGHLEGLQNLQLYDCRNLKRLPCNLERLTNLQDLHIICCPLLTDHDHDQQGSGSECSEGSPFPELTETSFDSW